MITAARTVSANSGSIRWQRDFEVLFPRIQKYLSYAFRDLNPSDKQEAIQEGTVNCMTAYARLWESGKQDMGTATSLACYAARQVRAGRRVATALNINDPLSTYAQRQRGIKVERLDGCRDARGKWVTDLAEDRKASVFDRVVFRIDVPNWLRTLSRKKQKIVKDLATGASTAEVAKKHGVSAGRISQVRKELFIAWHRFHGEALAHEA